MTTARQIKALVAPLLARHDDLVLVDRCVVITPIHHLIRGITIDRTGESSRCRPIWGISALIEEHEFFPLGFGDRLYRSGPSGLWPWSDPGLPKALVEAAESQALPRLRAASDFRDYIAIAFPNEPTRRMYSAAYVRYLFAAGDIDKARDILASDERAAGYWAPHLRRLGIRERLMERGDPLVAEDRTQLAAFLHESEGRTVEKLKIGHLWERTPFPLEEGVAQ